MKQLTLHIAEGKFQTFVEFIRTLDYVMVENEEDTVLQEYRVALNK